MRQKILAYEVTKIVRGRRCEEAFEIANNTFNSKLLIKDYQAYHKKN